MNALLDNLRFTIRSIFDLYSAFGKKLYVNSFIALIWIGLIGGLLAAGFTVLMEYLLNVPKDLRIGADGAPIALLFEYPEFLGLVQATIILLLGLYGVVIIRIRESGEVIRPSLDAFTGKIGTGEWKITGVGFLIILVVHALLFHTTFANEFIFMDLLYEATEVFKNYILPSFLAALVVLHSMWGKLSLDIVREYRSAWAACLVLLFSLNAVFSAADTVVYDTFIRFLLIPLMPSLATAQFGPDFLVVIILIFVFTILLAAFLYPAFALSLVLPFRYEEEKLAEKNEGEVALEVE